MVFVMYRMVLATLSGAKTAVFCCFFPPVPPSYLARLGRERINKTSCVLHLKLKIIQKTTKTIGKIICLLNKSLTNNCILTLNLLSVTSRRPHLSRTVTSFSAISGHCIYDSFYTIIYLFWIHFFFISCSM